MKSPAEMQIIQIDITNVCHRSCSNCTRFCGQHAKAFSMDLETFKRAVDSMEGYAGIVGIMGGEPTLHPQFGEMLEYYASKIDEPRPGCFMGEPTDNFQNYNRMLKYMRGRRRGLWSSLGNGYYKHFEQIQDVFAHQVLNDHRSVNTHQAILVTRKELGIADEEWFKLRDNCWIQNLWSASITPKGAFFCEIAASLDMLFDGPGGWPIEKGWWRRKPEDFKDQLHWCEMCSVALPVPTMNANEETDIVSPVMLEKLKQINGAKIRQKKYVVLEPSQYDKSKYGHAADPIWYLPADQRNEARISPSSDSLFPKKIEVVVLEGESAKTTLTREQAEQLEFNDWLAVFRRPELIDEEFLQQAAKCVLNPGCLLRHGKDVWLLNRRAKALRGVTQIRWDDSLDERWEKKKRIELLGYPQIGRTGWRGMAKMLMQRAIHRAMFLTPAWMWPQRKEKETER